MFPAVTGSASPYPCAEWQQGPALSVPALCVHQLFNLQVQRDPEAIAVVFGDLQVTYRDFDAQTNQFAHRLTEIGVVPESIVVVCLPRSVELIAALLATLKAGGAYLPIDPDWPEARKRLVLDELGPWPVVIADPASAVALGDHIRLIDPRDPAIGGYPTRQPDSNDHSTRQLAYVNFTSGSTGRPKGVMIEHRGILRLLDPGAPWRIGPGDRMLHLSPAAFDATTLEVWLPLLSGATLVVAPAGLLALDELAHLIRDQKISTLFLTTGLFHAMADAELPALAGVRQLMTGGEVLERHSMQAVLGAMPAGHTLIAVYGPTESTTFATHLPIAAGSLLPDRPIPIGRPLAATTAQVLDAFRGACRVGVVGQLHIGGEGLARGYLNNPELSAEKFIPDPHAPGYRLYRTGDLASWNPDGTLAFHGRLDDQVKVNGIRIEPAEIEAAMREHPVVARALAVLRRDTPTHPRLVAYWVPRPGQHASGGELRKFLAQKLPETMIPAAFVAMADFPLNNNGKVDRNALPEPIFGREDRRLLRTANETRLVEIWTEVLGHNDFGVDDNFFLVGGNSLSVVRLQSVLSAVSSCRFPLSTLFAKPTVREQAQWLEGGANSSALTEFEPESLVTFQPKGDGTPLVLVHGWNGKLFDLIELSRQLSTNRPLWGLQWPGDEAAPLTDREIREMAARYAEQIAVRHPHGAIHLYSYSIGGWYAFAVAEALLRHGVQIGLIAVGDSQAEDVRVSWRLRAQLLPGKLQQKLQEYVRHPSTRTKSFVANRLAALRHRFPRLEVLPAEMDLATRGQDPINIIRKGGFRPQPLPIEVHVFSTGRNERLLRRTWAHYAQCGVKCEVIFDDHYDFVRPEFAPVLAQALELALENNEHPGSRSEIGSMRLRSTGGSPNFPR